MRYFYFRYTLQGGYEKQVSLPSSTEAEEQLLTIVPKHTGHVLPLQESMLNPTNLKLIGDSALFMSRHFRTNFGPFWTLSNPGDNLKKIKEAATDVLLEKVNTLETDQQVLDSFESWLEVHLENCVLSFDDEDEQVPHLDVLEGVACLHAHAEEAQRQFGLAEDLQGMENMKQVLDLMVALWGRLRPIDNDEDMEMSQDDLVQDCHKTTMDRKEAVTQWLENVTKKELKEDLDSARNRNDKCDEMFALLSGNQRLAACDTAQDNSDHYLAMMISMASGPNLTFGQLIQNQLERWQESRSDKFIEKKRLKLFSLISGQPVWPGSETTINTCENLDWLRAFGLHLWYLISPAGSISDALNLYEEAFQKETSQFGAYAQAPLGQDPDFFDIKFHLLKLYADKSHALESIVNPKTYTKCLLDFKLGWIVGQVLKSLGYRYLFSLIFF